MQIDALIFFYQRHGVFYNLIEQILGGNDETNYWLTTPRHVLGKGSLKVGLGGNALSFLLEMDRGDYF